MTLKEIFNECVKEAIELGRPYMSEYADNQPTQQEWDLALILFKERI
jgi:hypothetical protein